jgi:hypothetical protein
MTNNEFNHLMAVADYLLSDEGRKDTVEIVVKRLKELYVKYHYD